MADESIAFRFTSGLLRTRIDRRENSGLNRFVLRVWPRTLGHGSCNVSVTGAVAPVSPPATGLRDYWQFGSSLAILRVAS